MNEDEKTRKADNEFWNLIRLLRKNKQDDAFADKLIEFYFESDLYKKSYELLKEKLEKLGDDYGY
jgi:hypothetical protein